MASWPSRRAGEVRNHRAGVPEYCRDRKFGTETMLDNMESYALLRINSATGEQLKTEEA
jgi:hypothetical protein